MFSWCKYLIVNLVFSHLGFRSGNLFLIAPFPDLCLLVLYLNVLHCFSNKKNATLYIDTSGVYKVEYINEKVDILILYNSYHFIST